MHFPFNWGIYLKQSCIGCLETRCFSQCFTNMVTPAIDAWKIQFSTGIFPIVDCLGRISQHANLI